MVSAPLGHAVDVLIIGGGPAGSATAIALRRRGVRRVLLADRPSRAPFAVGESVSPNIRAQLARLGLTDDLDQLGHLPYHGNLSLWGGSEAVVDDFLHRGRGHGWHLDRASFDAWLRTSAVSAGAELMRPAELLGVEPADDHFTVRLRCGDANMAVTTAIVVDATGRKGALIRRLGVRRRQLDRLVGLCTLAEPKRGSGPSSSLGGLSWIEPVAEGWWYAAGLPSGRVILALMTDSDLAQTGSLRDPRVYLRALAATSEVGRAVELPEAGFVVESFSAATQLAERAVGPRWLTVGDALFAFDPLTSSGITGALSDALAAADTIVAWFGSTGAEGAIEAAREYARHADATLRRYLSERRAWYSRERRWADHPFWLRRTRLSG